MRHLRFDEPVTILVGMGFPVTIENLTQTYTILQDWPTTGRNGAHRAALNACKAGLVGEIDAEAVRTTLVAFARRNDILVENLVPPAGPFDRTRHPRAG